MDDPSFANAFSVAMNDLAAEQSKARLDEAQNEVGASSAAFDLGMENASMADKLRQAQAEKERARAGTTSYASPGTPATQAG